jgi:nucleoside-diphosphate-sugar epimerase
MHSVVGGTGVVGSKLVRPPVERDFDDVVVDDRRDVYKFANSASLSIADYLATVALRRVRQ